MTPTQSLERLRQAAIQAGLLASSDPATTEEGVVTAAAADAIERLLDQVPAPEEPDEEACRRWHAALGASLAGPEQGERVHLRHVLFAVTPGVPVDALRTRAEACLLDLRARGRDASAETERFAHTARELSNCPSGAEGGDLGWLRAADCAPEFARAVFGGSEIGVLPRLATSRFGLHVVEVLAREAAQIPPYESVQEAVRQRLRQQALATALHAWVRQQLGDAADTSPLVQ